MADFLDKLLAADDSDGTIARAIMVVGKRAGSSEALERDEQLYLNSLATELPIPCWSDDKLEPLTAAEVAQLQKLGITPEQWEAAVIENFLENGKRGLPL